MMKIILLSLVGIAVAGGGVYFGTQELLKSGFMANMFPTSAQELPVTEPLATSTPIAQSTEQSQPQVSTIPEEESVEQSQPIASTTPAVESVEQTQPVAPTTSTQEPDGQNQSLPVS